MAVAIEGGEDVEHLCASINYMKQLESLGLLIKDLMNIFDANLVLASSPTLKHLSLRATLRPLTLDMIESFESTISIDQF